MIDASGRPPDASQSEGAARDVLPRDAYLDELVELGPDAVVLSTTRNPRILRVNREFTCMFGYTSEECAGNRLRDLVVPDGVDSLDLPEDPNLLAGGKVEREALRKRKDGTLFQARISAKRIRLSDEDDGGYLVFYRDITARKNAEALLTGEKRLLEVVAAGGSLTTTLVATCRLAQDVGLGSLVSILLLDRNEERLRCAASGDLPSSYLCALDGRAVDSGWGPCGTAAHLCEQVISADMAADERWTDEYKVLGSAHGLRACWSTPIKSSQGDVLGVFAVYSTEPASPTAEQQNSIEQLIRVASIAIERARSIDALHRSEERYAVAMKAASDGHMDWNLVTGELYISPRMLTIVGHPPDTTFVDRADWVRRFPFHPEDRSRWEAALAAHFASRKAKFKAAFRIVVNGETRWLAFNFIATRDAAGNVAQWTGSIADISDAKRDLATLLDAVPGMVALLSPTAEVDAVNNELLAYVGQPLEVIRQWGTNGIVLPEDVPRAAEVLRRAMSTGQPYETEIRLRRFDGVYRWTNTRGRPFLDSSGGIVRWFSIVSDVDDRKRAEDALRESEQRYERAMLAAEAGFWDWDVLTDRFYVSERLLEMSDIPAGTRFASRADFMSRVPFYPDDRAEWLRAAQELFASGGTRLAMELRFTRRGETRWTLLSGMCVRDAAGKIVRWTGSATDVTARKRAEEALRESEKRYERVMLASEAGLWDWDVVQDRYYLSPQMLAMSGIPFDTTSCGRAEFMQRTPFYPEDREKYQRAVRQLLAGGGTRLAMELRLLVNGETHWFNLAGMCFRDADEKPLRWTGSATRITDQKRAQEALRLSEERYALAMEASEEGHFDWNVQTNEIFASERLKQVLDLPADAQHRSRGDLMAAHIPYHPADRERMDRLTRDVLTGHATHQEFEYRLLRGPVQELRWIRTRWKIFRDAEGVAQRVIGVVSDITERKRAEDELRESEARFRTLTALWSDWYWRQDEHLRFTFSTIAVDPPNGYLGGPAIGKTRWDLPGIVPLSGSWTEHRKLLAARQPFRDFEYSRPASDGTIRYISTSGIPIFDEQGQFRGYHGVARNITERKSAEEKLRSRQEMVKLAQRAAGAVAFEWRVDRGQQRNRWSRELEAMFGIRAGSYDGTEESLKKLVHPEDWASAQSAVKSALISGDLDAEFRVIHPGGAIRWLHAKGQTLYDTEGNPSRVVGFMFDVTDRHLAEEELQRMERQLRQAQRLEALGTLAGGIAHDFNNLLGAILGYGEMALRNVRAGSRLRRDIESILIAGERGRALVDRILAFSRSGVGERVAVHVEKVVRETLTLFAAKLPRHIMIEPRLRAGNAAVMGDPTQIHQVLMNLLTNAVHAMHSSGTLGVSLDRVHLHAARVVTTGSLAAREYVVLDVSDSGSGIPAEVLEKIFDPFFTTKEVGVGTGLGLSLVHGIVIGLGGAVDVATAVGKGSSFKVYLPLAGEVAVRAAPAQRLGRKPRGGERGRIMVIDDEEALVALATARLTDLGYSASGFTSGAKAIEAFLAGPEQFDLVITDESMPGVSGSELIPTMRAVRPTIPVVVVSGYVSAQVIERAREAGATEVLRKPLPVRQLQTVLERILKAASDPGTNEQSRTKPLSGEPRRRRPGTPHSQSGPKRR